MYFFCINHSHFKAIQLIVTVANMSQNMNSQLTPHNLPNRASHGVPIISTMRNTTTLYIVSTVLNSFLSAWRHHTADGSKNYLLSYMRTLLYLCEKICHYTWCSWWLNMLKRTNKQKTGSKLRRRLPLILQYGFMIYTYISTPGSHHDQSQRTVLLSGLYHVWYCIWLTFDSKLLHCMLAKLTIPFWPNLHGNWIQFFRFWNSLFAILAYLSRLVTSSATWWQGYPDIRINHEIPNYWFWIISLQLTKQ